MYSLADILNFKHAGIGSLEPKMTKVRQKGLTRVVKIFLRLTAGLVKLGFFLLLWVLELKQFFSQKLKGNKKICQLHPEEICWSKQKY